MYVRRVDDRDRPGDAPESVTDKVVVEDKEVVVNTGSVVWVSLKVKKSQVHI
jgi:hypothetical protein